MNKNNILRVADAIEKGELVKRGIGFNMARFAQRASAEEPDKCDRIDGCGTVACIAGWAYAVRYPTVTPKRLLAILAREGQTGDYAFHRIPDTAAKYMGLNRRQELALFCGEDSPHDVANITPAHAVAVLRHLAETGEVDWSVGAP